MDLTSQKTIKELLANQGAKPSKTMGQNFLVHQPTLDKIMAAADIKNTETVVEIGPGLGTLTRELAKKAQKVIAIEKDRAMLEILKETLKDFKNIEVLQGNILEFSSLRAHKQLTPAFSHESRVGGWQSRVNASTSSGLPHLWARNDEVNYKLVANVPYYITSPIIRMFLEAKHPPQEIILMVQKEVAQRICAKPGDMSILAVSVQFYATAKIVTTVSKGCFWPVPNVDSAIIKITPNKKTACTENAELFFKIVKAGFSQPRKQLAGNLSKTLKKDKETIQAWLLKNNISPSQRAETLSIQDWVNLTKSSPTP